MAMKRLVPALLLLASLTSLACDKKEETVPTPTAASQGDPVAPPVAVEKDTPMGFSEPNAAPRGAAGMPNAPTGDVTSMPKAPTNNATPMPQAPTSPSAAMPPQAPAIGGGGGMMQAPPAGPASIPPDGKLSADGLTWTLPEGWATRPPAGIRLGTIVPTKGPDISIIRLVGDGGGMEMNLNRWRGQLMLPPLSSTDLYAGTENFEVSGVKITYIDIKSPNGRIVGAIIPSGGNTYFLKAQGASEAEVQPLVEGFKSILKTTTVK